MDLSGSTRAKMPAKDKGRKPTLPSVCRLRGCCAGISCAAALIGIIAGQAHTGLSYTAEGTRLIILRQGYFMSRPVPAAELDHWLSARRATTKLIELPQPRPAAPLG